MKFSLTLSVAFVPVIVITAMAWFDMNGVIAIGHGSVPTWWWVPWALGYSLSLFLTPFLVYRFFSVRFKQRRNRFLVAVVTLTLVVAWIFWPASDLDVTALFSLVPPLASTVLGFSLLRAESKPRSTA